MQTDYELKIKEEKLSDLPYRIEDPSPETDVELAEHVPVSDCENYQKSKEIAKIATIFSIGMIVGDLGSEIAKEIVCKVTVCPTFSVPIAFALVTFAIAIPLSFYTIGAFDCCCKDQLKEYLDFGCGCCCEKNHTLNCNEVFKQRSCQ